MFFSEKNEITAEQARRAVVMLIRKWFYPPLSRGAYVAADYDVKCESVGDRFAFYIGEKSIGSIRKPPSSMSFDIYYQSYLRDFANEMRNHLREIYP